MVDAASNSAHTASAPANGHSSSDKHSAIKDQARKARAASRTLQSLSPSIRATILHKFSELLSKHKDEILQENKKDTDAADKSDMTSSMKARLVLNDKKLKSCCDGCEQLASAEDPIGKIVRRTQLADGLELQQSTVPLGVLLIIFEGKSGWLRDLTAEGVEANPGPLRTANPPPTQLTALLVLPDWWTTPAFKGKSNTSLRGTYIETVVRRILSNHNDRVLNAVVTGGSREKTDVTVTLTNEAATTRHSLQVKSKVMYQADVPLPTDFAARDHHSGEYKQLDYIQYLQQSYPSDMLHTTAIIASDESDIIGFWIYFQSDLIAFDASQDGLVATAKQQLLQEYDQQFTGSERNKKNIYIDRAATRKAVVDYPGFVYVDVTTPDNYARLIQVLEDKIPTAHLYTQPLFRTLTLSQLSQAAKNLHLTLTASNHLLVETAAAVGPDYMFNTGFVELKMADHKYTKGPPEYQVYQLMVGKGVKGDLYAYLDNEPIVGMDQDGQLLRRTISCFILGTRGVYTHIIPMQAMVDNGVVQHIAHDWQARPYGPKLDRRRPRGELHLADVESAETDENYRKYCEEKLWTYKPQYILPKADREISAQFAQVLTADGDDQDTSGASSSSSSAATSSSSSAEPPAKRRSLRITESKQSST